MAIAISIVLAGFMGVILGMLGAGGSIVTVPILRYVVGFEAKEAIALSLAVVGVTSLIGAVGHWRSGNARLGVALPFGLVAMIGDIRTGDPADFSNFMAAVIDRKSYTKITGYIEEAKADPGIEIVAGGGASDEVGYFIEPTVLRADDPHARVICEEIFGPVLTVIPFSTPDEALKIANESMYGLAAAVWTQDIDKALKFAKNIRAGTVWINSYHTAGALGVPVMPFGGYKQSGIGRELGLEGMEMFMETKSIAIKLN